MMGIYEIVNWEDGKASSYVGSSVDIEHRWGQHRSALRAGRHNNARLQNAWNKYGEDAFVFSVLEEVGEDMLLVMEQEYLNDYFDRGHCYNIATTAGAPWNKGKTGVQEHSAETRRKMSETMMGNPNLLGYKHSDEARRKMSKARRGKHLTEEHRHNIAKAKTGPLNPMWGKKHTEETKRKMSKAQTGHTVSEETCRKLSEVARSRPPISEETRRKMSEAQRGNQNCLGRELSDETKQRISRALRGKPSPMKGRHHTEETKRKISKAKKGKKRKPFTEETKRKMSEARKRWWATQGAKNAIG